uniref:Exportin-2 n=1 Tax=Eptatretus burgeri TaxID=7764 RepID=A0A8C4QN71_EPTBU
MELTDSNLQTLTDYLQKTLSPDPSVRRPAEKFLESVEGMFNYPLLLLTLLEKSPDKVIRVCAAITFKNYIKRNWRCNEDEVNKICDSDRTMIKANIVNLMLHSPEQIQKQLSDAISTVGREDFPHKWPNLLADMVSRFQSGDFHIINGVLHTAHSLFKRYRHEFKSNELWSEIKLVLGVFATPLTELFKVTIGLCNEHATDANALKVLFSSLILISKVFYSLNFQDLPEFFEDNMESWMANFHTLLTFDNKLLHTDDESEAGPLELLKSQICDNVALYAQKYDEEFRPFLPQFVTAVWHLLVSAGSALKYDLLVSNAMQFLASVSERQHYKQLFEERSTLTSICEKVILPNMECRTVDEEAFEDNAEEYIRRDIEGSDVDTRRRAACDLVRSLCRFFEGPVTEIFSVYVASMLAEYAKEPARAWKHKDTAIFLVTSLASKAQTHKHGITQANELVNLTDFFIANILPDLRSPNVNQFPVLKADAIKYVMIFRSQVGLLNRNLVSLSIISIVFVNVERAGGRHDMSDLEKHLSESLFLSFIHNLIKCSLLSLCRSVINEYKKQIFILLFQRLQSSKTTKFIKSFLVFINLFCVKYGAIALQELIDSIQPSLFGMVLEKVLVPEVQKVSGTVERKICAVGMTRILTECPAMMNCGDNKLWSSVLQALVSLFELPEDDSAPCDEHFIEVEESPGYQAAFSQLAFAGRPQHDPVGPNIANAKLHLAHSLRTLSTACPGRVQLMISSDLSPEVTQYLHGYLQAASVTLV